jgi:hypothetical protein
VNRVFELAFGRVKKFLTGRPGFANLCRLGTDRHRDRPEPAKPQQPSVADKAASRITSEFPALPGILVGLSDAEQLRCLHWPPERFPDRTPTFPSWARPISPGW